MRIECFLLVFACASQFSYGARRDLRIPEVNVSSPAEINNLNGEKIISAKKTRDEDVEDTIKEVEALIKSDPKLPRLTRGEILDIIDNITKSDQEKLKKAKTRDQKAIMVVMPYSPKDSGDVQELYTKPPITQIIGEQQKPKKRKLPTQKKPPRVWETTTEFSKSSTTVSTTLETTTRPAVLRRKRPSTTTPTSIISEIPSFKPLRRKTTPKPSTIRFNNHKYPEEEIFLPTTSRPIYTSRKTTPTSLGTIPQSGINVITPPKFHPKPEIPFKTSSKIEKPLYKPKPTQTSPTEVANVPIPEDFKDVLKNLDILIKDNPKYHSQYDALSPLPKNPQKPQENVHTILASMTAYTPPQSTTPSPDLQNVVNNLTPDMKELLMNFGLIPDPNKKESPNPSKTGLPISPNSPIKPDSYTSFKPLPETSLNNPEDGMDELLASFGLGSKRGQKSISHSKPANQLSQQDSSSSATSDKKQHVFNPSDSQYATQDELDKLNKLMGVIKQLEKLNGTATEEDLKQVDLEGLKELIGSFNVPLDEQLGPNPLDYHSGVEKNEVKRQQTTTTTPTTTTIESKNPSLAALEDSFGGSSDTASEAVVPSTEAPKKTGFYYLVDWNTFLDIDNQKGKRVNLRFQPTIGDPKRFFSVSVP